jgi:gamma-glutamylcyclotransferase (GGCT)/AIG2-like uncharacterized protein YtfP
LGSAWVTSGHHRSVLASVTKPAEHLLNCLAEINNERSSSIDGISALEIELANELEFPNQRLASYGSLRPGESNFKVVEEICGSWAPGVVRGTIAVELGYFVYYWEQESPNTVPVLVLNSIELDAHWPRIDEFEGDNYRRVLVPVELDDGRIQVCNIYAKRLPG